MRIRGIESNIHLLKHMKNKIDETFNIFAMNGEVVIRHWYPNAKFVAYQVMKYLWHPFTWPILPISILVVTFSKRHFKYWLTNKRLIVSSGIFGFKVSSLQLERVSDVILVRSMLMRVLGTSCLSIMDISGSGGCFIISVDNSEDIQLAILEAIQDCKNT
jgi:uncharacterized membrane protein YdbT with pleckstrin-like domain